MEELPYLSDGRTEESNQQTLTFLEQFHPYRCRIFSLGRHLFPSDVPSSSITEEVDELVKYLLIREYCQIKFAPFFCVATRVPNTFEEISFFPALRDIFKLVSFTQTWLHALNVYNDFFIEICEMFRLFILKNEISFYAFLGDYHQFAFAHSILEKGAGNQEQATDLRQMRGMHYTPSFIVDYLTTRTLDLACKQWGHDSIRIFDPSCGSGTFLLASFRYLLHKYDGNPKDVMSDVMENRLHGADIDEKSVKLCKIILSLEFLTLLYQDGHNITNISIPTMDHIMSKSFFDIENRYIEDKKISIFLGGPPFVRYSVLKQNGEEELIAQKRKFFTARDGQYDLYYLFVEHAIQLLKGKSGFIGFSLSNSFLHNIGGRVLRGIIHNESQVHEIIHFTDPYIYPSARTPIALLLLSVNIPNKYNGYFHTLIKNRSYRQILDSIYQSNSCFGDTSTTKVILNGDIYSCCKKTVPYAAIASKCEWITFNHFIRVASGLSTGNDALFIFEKKFGNSGAVYCVDRNKQMFHFEPELFRDICRGRNITGFANICTHYVCFFPLDSFGNFVTWKEMENRFPRIFRYLSSRITEPQYGLLIEKYKKYQKKILWPAIICSRILSQQNFVLCQRQDLILHSSTLSFQILNSRMSYPVLLAYMNSSSFWNQLVAIMPHMKERHVAIRQILLKSLKIPSKIAFPEEKTIREAEALISNLDITLKKDKMYIYSEIDQWIESLID